MLVAIIDADLVGRDKHRFPNLACEKISAYHKELGDTVELIWNILFLRKNYLLTRYDKIYISKVFTDTHIPIDLDNPEFLRNEKVEHGGTGFFFDKAPNLPDEIEHHMPDYTLYDNWIDAEVAEAEQAARLAGKSFDKARFMVQFKEYTDYSIGFLTRGCFRKCKFCVNQKYDHVFLHSPLNEFYDPNRKKICLLDDNVFGCGPHWKELFEQLQATGKPFKFKQGMDERILTDERCRMLFTSKYDGDYTFAFDNIADYDLIHEKLKLIRKYASPKASIKFYVLVGFESTDAQDIENAFKRIELLMRYHCLPYIMRYQNKNDTPWKRSEYRDLYVSIARWANQPSMFKKNSFRQFCVANQKLAKAGTTCATYKSMEHFENNEPEIAEKYFDIRFEFYGTKEPTNCEWGC